MPVDFGEGPLVTSYDFSTGYTDGTLKANAEWEGPMFLTNGDLQVTSGVVTHGVDGTYRDAYTADSFGPDGDYIMEVAALPSTGGGGRRLFFHVCVVEPGFGTVDSWTLDYQEQTGDDRWRLRYMIDGAIQTAIIDTNLDGAAGMLMGIRIDGTEISVYTDIAASGTWTQLGATQTITAPPAGPLGIESNGGTLQVALVEVRALEAVPPDDVDGPSVLSVTPADGTLDVALSTTVVATFSEALDPTTVNTTNFTLTGPSGIVPASVGISGGDTIATLTPTSALDNGTQYAVLDRGGGDRRGGQRPLRGARDLGVHHARARPTARPGARPDRGGAARGHRRRDRRGRRAERVGDRLARLGTRHARPGRPRPLGVADAVHRADAPRAPPRARPGRAPVSPSRTFVLEGFGSEGVVSDLTADRLKASQLCEAEDMVLVDGIPTERGGWTTTGDLDPLANANALTSVMAVRFEGASADTLVVSDYLTFGEATAGSAGDVGFVLGEVRARAFYRGESLLPSSDGLVPMLRWSGIKTGYTGGTGTYTIADDRNNAVGSGTNFDPHVPVGTYIGSRWEHRVVSRTSDTAVAVADIVDYPVASTTTNPSPTGLVGLKTLVTDKGIISHTSSSTTVTGSGTGWLSSGPGYGSMQVGDWIVTKGGSWANAMRVTGLGSDTSCTVAANSVGAITDQPYVLLRPAVGREVCVHDNALWIAGVEWNKDVLYTTPPGYAMGHVFNGAFSELTEADEAARLFEAPIRSSRTSGEIVSLLSTPWGLLVGMDDSLHTVRGQYPALQVDKLADVGVIDQRAAVGVDDMAVIAGNDGIFAWRGGQLDNITRGREGEWRERIHRGMTRCVLGVVRGHLFISFEAGGAPECWVYDLRREVHLGNFRSDTPSSGIESATWMDSSRLPGSPDRLLFVADGILRVQDASTTIPEPGGLNPYPSENGGRLSVTSGTNIGGGAARLRRITGLKVSYVCFREEGGEPGTLDVGVQIFSGFSTVKSLPATTAIIADRAPARDGADRRGPRRRQARPQIPASLPALDQRPRRQGGDPRCRGAREGEAPACLTRPSTSR